MKASPSGNRCFHNLFRLLIDKGAVSTAEVVAMLDRLAPELTENLEFANAGGMVKDLARLLSSEAAMQAALKEPKH